MTASIKPVRRKWRVLKVSGKWAIWCVCWSADGRQWSSWQRGGMTWESVQRWVNTSSRWVKAI